MLPIALSPKSVLCFLLPLLLFQCDHNLIEVLNGPSLSTACSEGWWHHSTVVNGVSKVSHSPLLQRC